MSPPSPNECTVVRLTPSGRGAVAVILVVGLNALEVVDGLFHPADSKDLSGLSPQSIRYGRWGCAQGEDVIVVWSAAGNSPTAGIEVHCHGGDAAAGAIVQSLEAVGCRSMPWREWVQSREKDPIRSAARVQLAAARTTRSARHLLDQYQGALSQRIVDILELVKLSSSDRALESVEELLGWSTLGLHLVEPWRVVLSGPPNVGKSSLINKLVGFDRSIVSSSPGTTRDVVSAVSAVDGWPVAFYDTAGLRESTDEVESAGVRMAEQSVAISDLTIEVTDVENAAILRASTGEAARRPTSRLLVMNKIDLFAGGSSPSPPGYLLTSAATGEGIDRLLRAIGVALAPTKPQPGTAMPFTREQVSQLELAAKALQAGLPENAASLLRMLLNSAEQK